MPSLLEALEVKYGLGCGDALAEPNEEKLVSIFVPKLPPRLIVPELLVLNDCDIDQAGDPEDLKKKCCSVKELDLAQNKLQNWSEVFNIISQMPRIEFVNLSLNRLHGPIEPPRDFCVGRLKNLVLNNTRLDWDSVETLLSLVPALQELHLSLNDYTNVLIDTLEEDLEMQEDFDIAEDDDVCTCGRGAEPIKRSVSVSSNYKRTNAHEGVRKLHFTGNPITEWTEICRLGRVFPNLESLVLAECPLRAVEPVPKPAVMTDAATSIDADVVAAASTINTTANQESCDPPHAYFRSLTFLNLSSTNINTWDDIDRLARFPALKNLRVQNWPLWDKCESTEHERRQLLIARLPYVETLNGGGVISSQEREDAERAFIRYYMDRPESDRPERYNELVTIHGKLDPLVNIDLRPEKRVKVTFTYGDTSEVRSVDVYRTVIDLKSRLERVAGIPAGKMRLYYMDQDLRDHAGPEEMKYPHKRLYSYNISSGDEIIIDQKR